MLDDFVWVLLLGGMTNHYSKIEWVVYSDNAWKFLINDPVELLSKSDFSLAFT